MQARDTRYYLGQGAIGTQSCWSGGQDDFVLATETNGMNARVENGRGMGNPSPFMEGLVEGRGKGWCLSTPPNPSL